MIMGLNDIPTVFIRNLGKIAFKDADRIQKSAAKTLIGKLRSGECNDLPNHLFLLEHHPVYTVGIRDIQYTKEEEKLRNLGAEFVRTDRGGLITFHGPGQLVAYPVLYLGDFNQRKSMKWYVRQLENTIIGTCETFGVKATVTGDVGVWIEDRKIAAIGIHGSRHVTTHGIALNCKVDLHWFSHIVPCGLEGKTVTSLAQETERDISVEETTPVFLRCFQRHFPCHMEHLD